jgi:hypothetical protein
MMFNSQDLNGCKHDLVFLAASMMNQQQMNIHKTFAALQSPHPLPVVIHRFLIK